MNSISITSWEGAEAYFTFAGNSFAVFVLLTLAVAIFVYVIAHIYHHENQAYETIVQLYPSLEEEMKEKTAHLASDRVGFSQFVEPMMPTQKASEI